MQLTSWLGQTSPYYTNDYYYSSSPAADAATGGAILSFILIMLFIALVGYVVTAILLGLIFKKAGIESWKAWVPIYNTWTMLEMGGQKGYWAVIALVPVVGIVSMVFMFIAMYHIGLNFGKEGAFVLLAIFLPIVWLIWLAVDKSTWKGATPAPAVAQPSGNPPTTPQPPTIPPTPPANQQ